MYRKLLYNDNCILNTISNTVIFDFNDEWKIYLEWANSNIKLVNEDIVKKNNTLLWNGGVPDIKNNKKLEYNQDGILIKEEGEDEVLYYRDNTDNTIYKREYKENNEIVLEESYSENETLYKEIDYKKNISKKYNSNTGHLEHYSRVRGDITYNAYYNSGTLYKSDLIKNEIPLRIKEMYPSSKQIKSKLKHISNSIRFFPFPRKDLDVWEFTEYWISGIVRSSGELVNNKMNGVWEYYHHNGMLESKHTFKDGEFIGDSFIYYENGELIKHINHD